jgi:hypothetical protein
VFLRAFALRAPLDYDPSCSMTNENILRCDGCGQPASPEHIAKRLQRLEWTTRYRPLHIGTLLFGAIPPRNDSEFLYAEGGEFAGEAGIILKAAGLSTSGKSVEATLAEFQRCGFLLTHILECPLEQGASSPTAVQAVLEERFPAMGARIRRSLRPKRLMPVSLLLEPVLERLKRTDLGCPMVLDGAKAFALDGDAPDQAVARLRHALIAVSASAR